MAVLKGLKKTDREQGRPVDAETFIRGATERVNQLKPGRMRHFQRCTFSLTPEMSQLIDQLAAEAPLARISRSDVVKAGILALNAMSEAERQLLLKQAKG